MGDQWNQPTQAPNADVAAGLGTQAAAAQQMPQQSGLMGTLNNPLVQMLLGTYAGAVGSPAKEGLGGAIKGGITGGLGMLNQAQEQQMKLPLQQAQLQEAQMKTKQLGMQLRPLTKDEVQSITDWKNALQARVGTKDPPDPYEISYVNQLESQARGGQITSQQLLASMEKFHESNLIQAMLKNRQFAQSTEMQRNLGLLPPDNQGQGQPPAGQPGGQPPAAKPPGDVKPSPYANVQWPPQGKAQKMDLGNGLGMRTYAVAPNGHAQYLDDNNKWVDVMH